MYPSKGGRRVKAASADIEFEPTEVKNEKITFACNGDRKDKLIELCSKLNIVMSGFGDKLMDWIFEVEADLEEGEDLFEYLYTIHQKAQESRQEEKDQKWADQMKDAKIARQEKEIEELKKQLAKLKEENAQKEGARIAKEKTHLGLELSEPMQEALLYFIADRIKQGENLTVEGVIAHLLCLGTASGSNHIAQDFKLHGKFRTLTREKQRK